MEHSGSHVGMAAFYMVSCQAGLECRALCYRGCVCVCACMVFGYVCLHGVGCPSSPSNGSRCMCGCGGMLPPHDAVVYVYVW
jgi:hypothetical protein